MINLIPPAAKKRVITEYWFRALTLWAFLGGSALFLMATLFIPLNIYIANQEDYLAARLVSNQAEQDNHLQNTNLLTKANRQAAILLNSKQEYTVSELLPVVRTAAGNAVVLEDISLTQVSDPVLVISGVAATRQSLVQLRDALEATENFLRVDLPIGNLIKERDVPFMITISLATSTPQV